MKKCTCYAIEQCLFYTSTFVSADAINFLWVRGSQPEIYLSSSGKFYYREVNLLKQKLDALEVKTLSSGNFHSILLCILGVHSRLEDKDNFCCILQGFFSFFVHVA